MNLNPRKIRIPIGKEITNISIENSNFQLINLTYNQFNISVAINAGDGYDKIPEDELLNQTLLAMNDNPEWSIGCKTTRSNVITSKTCNSLDFLPKADREVYQFR